MKAEKKRKKIEFCSEDRMDIAIIGMACLFPEANNYHAFWSNLENSVNSIKKVPSSRWDIEQHYSQESSPGKTQSKWCGLLEDIEGFDNRFFDISAREARNMDPQQRLLLQEAWHCIEDAALSPERLKASKTAVYVGVMASDYQHLLRESKTPTDSFACLGNYAAILANRISYAFGLSGPSYTINAACASSLVALHEAKRTLTSGDCDYALAAGVNLNLHPWKYISFSQSRMLSPDGQCKTFDLEANGYVPGDGIGVLLLQPLAAALQEGANIHGVIKGSAINHGGRAQSITAPKVAAQEEVIAAAHRESGITPDSITYLEAHGTGTSLGDPIELEALTRAFRQQTEAKEFCSIGSVKSNIGHLEAAAGIAGVVKVLTMFRHKKIPKSLNISRINPILHLSGSPFIIATESSDWKPAPGHNRLRAGVSSFGFGGSNAHMVLESPPPDKSPSNGNKATGVPRGNLFLLSAKSSASLRQMVTAWQEWAQTDASPTEDINDICPSLMNGRAAFPFRHGCYVENWDDLRQWLANSPDSFSSSSKTPWCLQIEEALNQQTNGQASGMVNNHVLSTHFATIEKYLASLPQGRDLLAGFSLFPWREPNQALYSFLSAYTFLAGLIDLGFQPDLLRGQGSASVTALVLSGIIDLEDGLQLMTGRKKWQQIAVNRPHTPYFDHLNGITIAPCHYRESFLRRFTDGLNMTEDDFPNILRKAKELLNNQHTFRKDLEIWDEILKNYDLDCSTLLGSIDTSTCPLNTSQPDHLLLLTIILSALQAIDRKWDLTEQFTIDQSDFSELLLLIRQKVLSRQQVVRLFCDQDADLAEMANHINSKLTSLDKDVVRNLKGGVNLPLQAISGNQEWFDHLVNGEGELPDLEIMNMLIYSEKTSVQTAAERQVQAVPGRQNQEEIFTHTLLNLWLKGVEIDWQKLHPLGTYKRLPLPTYRFEQQHFQLPQPVRDKDRPETIPARNLSYRNCQTTSCSPPCFRRKLSPKQGIYKEHVIVGRHLVPAAAIIKTIFEALEKEGGAVYLLKKLVFHNPGILNEEEESEVRVTLDCRKFRVEMDQLLLCSGEFETGRPDSPPQYDPAACQDLPPTQLNDLYENLRQIGYHYEDGLKIITQQWHQDSLTLFQLEHPLHLQKDADTGARVLDGLFQTVLTHELQGPALSDSTLLVPHLIGSITLFGKSENGQYAYLPKENIRRTNHGVTADLALCDGDGQSLLTITDMFYKKVPNSFIEDFSSVRPPSSWEVLKPLFYEPYWKKTAPLIQSDSVRETAILLTDHNQTAQTIVRELAKTYRNVHRIVLDDSSSPKSSGLTVNPRDGKSYEHVLSEIAQSSGPIENPHIFLAFAGSGHPPDPFEEQENWSWQSRELSCLFHLAKSLIRLPEKTAATIVIATRECQAILPADEANGLRSGGLSGMAMSLAHEHPALKIKLVDFGAGFPEEPGQTAQMIGEAFAKDDERLIAYRKDQRYVKALRILETEPPQAPALLRDDGVYLIIGGAGGLGLLTAKLIHSLCSATLVLTGRSPLTVRQQEHLEKISQSGGRLLYLQGDVSHQQQMTALVDTVKERFGKINGLIHAAGLLEDKLLVNKTWDSVERVLAPKIQGICLLNQLTKTEPLDFFIAFSSVVALSGNRGQSDYGAANSFMDCFIQARSRAKDRYPGTSMTINWSLWEDAGMGRNDLAKNNFQELGLGTLSKAMGRKTLARIFQGEFPTQIMVTSNRSPDWAATFRPASRVRYVPSEVEQSEYSFSPSLAALKNYLTELIAEKLGHDPGEMNESESFFSLGMESILLQEIMTELEKNYERLPATLLFEYPTLNELAANLLGKKVKPGSPLATSAGAGPEQGGTDHNPPLFSAVSKQSSISINANNREIAIIGLSGRFPKSPDLASFWSNLMAGRDCVEEIPAVRWQHNRYYSPEPGAANKSYGKWGGFIDDVDKFDPLFFNITPQEAELMDPQQRLFLECCWQVMENAGYGKRKQYRHEQVGLFVGVMWNEYSLLANQQAFLADQYGGPGSLYWAIANRVSYLLDLKGPSMAVDTACSSSLVCVHLASQAILAGECDMAIAGGVNLSLHPSKYIYLSQARFLSTDGKCRSFGDGGNGYVPGEGVGAVLLKSLDKALSDNDHIHAIIKGTAINHGGRATGFTVPNPDAHARLISKAMGRAGVKADEIDYLECHGTGTALGDPIEIRGLSTAFQKQTERRSFCPIGSVKSNIGHLEAAAGIAALIKVILCLENHKIPQSLHCQELNKNIDFKETPFFVADHPLDWPRQNNRSRIAGISSFGAGGSNAHLVVAEPPEEAPLFPTTQQESDLQNLFVFSAHTDEQLLQFISRMLEFLKQENQAPASMRDIAATLQMGREELWERLAILATDRGDLIEKLEAVISRGYSIAGVVRGTVMAKSRSRRKDKTPALSFEKMVSDKDLAAIATQWTSGAEINWQQLHGEYPVRKIPLPTYPFARQRYWLDAPPITNQTAQSTGQGSRLHPLVDRNTSTLRQQKFVTHLQPDAFLLTDHMVQGAKTLPGAAFIEMIRAAAELAGETPVAAIRDLVWSAPLQAQTDPKDVTTSFFSTDQKIHCEVSTASKQTEGIHARAVVVYEEQRQIMEEQTAIAVQDIQDRCPKTLPAASCYKRFLAMGLDYGPGFQVIQEVHFNDSESLARLRLPPHLTKELEHYVLHPALVDGALQSVLCLLPASDEAERLFLPFAMEEILFLGPIPQSCLVHTRRLKTGNADRTSFHKFDIQITDDTGLPLLRINGFSLRSPDEGTSRLTSEPSTETLYFRPQWQESVVAALEVPLLQDDAILVFDTDLGLAEALASGGERRPKTIIQVKAGHRFARQGPELYTIRPREAADYVKLLADIEAAGQLPDKIIHTWTMEHSGSPLDDQLEVGLYSVFQLSQAMMARQIKRPIRLLFAFLDNEEPEQQVHPAFIGFARSLRREQPNFLYKSISFSTDSEFFSSPSAGTIANLLSQEFATEETEIRYDSKGRRLIKQMKEFSGAHLPQLSPLLRTRGIYLITGGAGGLGLLFAEYLSRHYQARLLLCGRRDLDDRQTARLDYLCTLGADIHYIKADVSIEHDAKRMFAEAQARFGTINGVLHSAGITRDGFLLRKKLLTMTEVLRPKVQGTIFLDKASAKLELDFFVLFSSTTGLTGNLGQCDYAFANSFQDAFAALRHRLREKGQRHGESISINWPLWEEGGMGVDQQNLALLRRNFGMEPLESNQGLAAFVDFLQVGGPQAMVISGDGTKIRQVVENLHLEKEGLQAERKEESSSTPRASTENRVNREFTVKVEDFLKKIVTGSTKIPESQIDSHEALETYGIDSVMVMDMTSQLEKHFGELSKTLFFEYQTIAELAGYLIEDHGTNLEKILEWKAPQAARLPAAPPSRPSPSSRNRFMEAAPSVLPESPPHGHRDDIAIIGISGRYPQATDLEQFWRNLLAGKDCVTEIPADRWDLHQYFNRDKNQTGSSYSKWGGFLDNIDRFDPLFFNISPKEAENMDPQERLFLETAWHTLEDAAYTRASLRKQKVGVFVGVMWGLYQMLGPEEYLKGNMIVPNSSYASVANRVSYFFDFKGPSMAIDSMCSSSLTAIHLACESLHRGESDLALAGGVNVSLHPAKYILLSHGHFLSSDGKCRSFGAGGDGYVPGEGVGAVLLKPLRSARQNRDRILAVIKGSSLNHGGKTNGYTVPNPGAQSELIKSAMAQAKADPRRISYIETHGTGTALGDPIEMTGLVKAFANGSANDLTYTCAIGSVKSNIGHLEAAAGIAALTKVVLQMQHETLVPSLHSKELNPNINFSHTPFVVQQQVTHWPRPAAAQNGRKHLLPRQAGINSFGAGGHNAHLLVEEYIPPASASSNVEQSAELILLSARHVDQLKSMAENLLAFLDSRQTTSAETWDVTAVPWQSLLRKLMEMSAHILQVSTSDLKETSHLRDYGFDAFSLTQLAQNISHHFAIDLPPSLFMEITSLPDLADYLATHHLIAAEPADEKSGQQTGNKSEEANDSVSLKDLAYTLQTGREPFNERLAVVAGNLQELKTKLHSYCQSVIGADVHQGSLDSEKTELTHLASAKEGQRYIESLLENRNLDQLARLWIHGVAINWHLLHRGSQPQRISAPGYPFARQRCWVTQVNSSPLYPLSPAKGQMLHPLLDSNDSTLEEQCYTKLFSSADPAIRHHQIEERIMVPATVYLEMAKAAGELANPNSRVGYIRDVVWLAPLMINEAPKQTKITLLPENESVDFEIHTSDDNDQSRLSARGSLIYRDGETGERSTPMDLESIKGCLPVQLRGEECYQHFHNRGFRYGPDFQVIQHLWIGDTEALARLELPPSAASVSQALHLNPFLLDGSLQTVLGLIVERKQDKLSLPLPFMVDEVELFAPLPASCYAYVAEAQAEQRDCAPIPKFHIRLLDDRGNCLIQLTNLVVRAADGKDTTIKPSAVERAPIRRNEVLDKSEEMMIRDILEKIENGELKASEAEKYLEQPHA